MTKDTSLPAFPVTEAHGANNGCPGMTYRQWLAGLAMQQMIAVEYEGYDPAERAAIWARDAHIVADAMIAEGSK